MDSMIVELPHQPSWQLNFKTVKEPGLINPYYSKDDDHQIGSYGNSFSGVSIDDFSDISSSFPASTAMSLVCQPMNLPVVHDLGGNNLLVTLEDQLVVDEIDDVSDWLVSESSLMEEQNCLEDEERSQHMSPMSREASKNAQNLSSLPPRLDNELLADANWGIFHLLKAYGEAIEMDASELAEEISRKLQDKSSLTGSPLERLAYFLIRVSDKQVEPLMEEAGNNYGAAFKAFYQIFPYGRFAHFCANSVILAAVPDEAELVHIVDFDIGTGIQWPPVIEALARQGKRAAKLTAIKWEADDISPVPGQHKLEQTKENLIEFAQTFGFRLKIEEVDMEGLKREMKKVDRTEWLAFNCMIGLPHMGKERTNISSVIDFLRIAKNSTRGRSNGRASITFGDGIGWGRGLGGRSGYGTVFEGLLAQFQALLESMTCHFLQHLREARIAMECLFLMPYFASAADMQMWDEISRESKALSELGLEACKMQEATIMEVKELVGQGEGSYWASTEGVLENQMVLGYKATPLVKVSTWR